MDDLAGADSQILRLGGYPIILFSGGAVGGPVAAHLTRFGPSVHSLAWEVDDLWATQNLLVRRGIGLGAINVPGRHFFMHPRDTRGVLMEWTDGNFGENERRPDEGGGVVDIDSIAWVSAAVTDAEETAAFLGDLCGASPIGGNEQGPSDREVTIDVVIGDLTLRLVTPRSTASPYADVLAAGPRLCALALKVGDLDKSMASLEEAGAPVVRREGNLAATDPAATFGIPIEWTA